MKETVHCVTTVVNTRDAKAFVCKVLQCYVLAAVNRIVCNKHKKFLA
jgi:hypothetical protein